MGITSRVRRIIAVQIIGTGIGTGIAVPANLFAMQQAAGTRDDGQWTLPGKDYAGLRYSGLTRITPANAAQLRPVWTFSTGVLGGHEGQPLVVNNTMYVVTPYPNVLYAFDLTEEGNPRKCKYRPTVNPNATGIACSDAINRGKCSANGSITHNPLHRQTGL